uniref:Uncharacterized protein n=1 Tax=Steinernema glaseri TaxID=37863 RepID=A0A1I7ZWR4_9BILA
MPGLKCPFTCTLTHQAGRGRRRGNAVKYDLLYYSDERVHSTPSNLCTLGYDARDVASGGAHLRVHSARLRRLRRRHLLCVRPLPVLRVLLEAEEAHRSLTDPVELPPLLPSLSCPPTDSRREVDVYVSRMSDKRRQTPATSTIWRRSVAEVVWL